MENKNRVLLGGLAMVGGERTNRRRFRRGPLLLVEDAPHNLLSITCLKRGKGRGETDSVSFGAASPSVRQRM